MDSAGGFGSYLLAMSQRLVTGSEKEGGKSSITAGLISYKNPALGWMIGFLFVVAFRGLFTIVPLTKIMVIDLKLTYPSGTATAHLINSLHSPAGAKTAKKQFRMLSKFFSFSFLWGAFQWFFTAGDDCGFKSFPTFGLKAYHNKFFFDFSATYVGVGMICPHIVNVSLLLGGILSWGIMWPLIHNKEGDWFPAGPPHGSFQDLQDYKVFIAIALILGDGLYNGLKVLRGTVVRLISKIHGRDPDTYLPSTDTCPATSCEPPCFDERRRTRLFVKDQISTWVAVGCYLVISAISSLTLPHIFQQLRWFHVVVIYIFAPAFAFCDAFVCGLTDWSLPSLYGKLAIFVVGAWAGGSHGGVLAGLAAGGVTMNIVSTASDLMQDMKTGYLTLASPRSMFVSQLIGTAIGCFVSPCVFLIFYKAFPDLGEPGSPYPAPFAAIYYNVAKVGTEGFSALPRNCLKLCYGFFSAAIFINVLRDAVGKKRGRFIPVPMAMAIPFYLGTFLAIDMCVGGLIIYIWERINKAEADAFAPAVASGLICGDGTWTLPSSVLALFGVKPPICMKFLSRGENRRVDKLLGS